MDFGAYPDNPFSLEQATKRHSGRRSVMSLLKLLLLVAVCLAVTVVVGSQSRRLVLHFLTHDLDTLAGEQKQARLKQIADLDLLGIEPLALTLADQDVDVARTAFDLLRTVQTRWTILDRSQLRTRQAALVDGIRMVAVALPDDRTGWGTSLLQPTIEATVDSRDQASRLLYEDAVRTMEMLSLTDRAGPSILNNDRLVPVSTRPMIVRSRPLPVTASGSVDEWTDWPPPRDEPPAEERLIVETEYKPQPRTSATPIEIAAAYPIEDSLPESNAETVLGGQVDMIATEQLPPTDHGPTLYKSRGAVALQPLRPGETVLLRDINDRDFTTQPEQISEIREADQDNLNIRPVAHLVDSPLETFDDKSVMYWLASPDPVFRNKARLELTGRGYGDSQIELATQIVTGDSQTRRALVDKIARSQDLDPRPWLLMMLDDRSREVRLRVVSVLATLNDRAITQRLRMHLMDERDPTVAARIRRLLDVR